MSHQPFSQMYLYCTVAAQMGTEVGQNPLMPFVARNSAKRWLIAFGLVCTHKKHLPLCQIGGRQGVKLHPLVFSNWQEQHELGNDNSNSSRPTQVSNLKDLACREGDNRSTIRVPESRRPKSSSSQWSLFKKKYQDIRGEKLSLRFENMAWGAYHKEGARLIS